MLIAISQRAEKGKYRDLDVLEKNYVDYFSKFGILIPIPNNPEKVKGYFKLPIERIILSGGTDVGESEERDDTERKLLDFAIAKNIPVLGICRGMQFTNVYFGGEINRISKGHIAIDHKIQINEKFKKVLGEEAKVNSYHKFGILEKNLSPELKCFAEFSGGLIEGLYHPSLPIAGIMWHPERKSPDEEFNKKIIQAFLNKDLFWKK